MHKIMSVISIEI